MASILFLGSFLAGSLITLLIPVGLLIALLVWHGKAVVSVPRDPSQAAMHAAGPAELEGRADAGEPPAPAGPTSPPPPASPSPPA